MRRESCYGIDPLGIVVGMSCWYEVICIYRLSSAHRLLCGVVATIPSLGANCFV